MHDHYYFFFSYASVNHANAKWERRGNNGNYLDEFYDALCREVSDKAAQLNGQVAYRDRRRLKVGDFWGPELIQGLQRSKVLLAVLSPHYLQSQNCGKELGFFDRRVQEFIKNANAAPNESYRILPLFWEDADICLRNASPGVARFLQRYNFTQQGMPENYPAVGLSQICKLRPGNDYEQLCHSIAKRIVELANSPHELPKAPGPDEFNKLESIYLELERNNNEDLVLNGPVGANVVYLVGTRSEMKAAGLPQIDSYGEKREEWCPFQQSPGATVELLTKEGANLSNLKTLRNLDLPDNLVSLIKTAARRGSPVLLVLDRYALSLPHVIDKLNGYDAQNFNHCGLVTAGGGEVAHEQVQSIFNFKCKPNYPHHIWNTPTTRHEYVSSIALVLSGIKQQLLLQAHPEIPLTSAAIPGLSGPTGA